VASPKFARMADGEKNDGDGVISVAMSATVDLRETCSRAIKPSVPRIESGCQEVDGKRTFMEVHALLLRRDVRR
jgi:hypothetical protein